MVDDVDLKILDALQSNSTLHQAEIGRRVGLSAASVNERIHKMERLGIIRGYVALLDGLKLGRDMAAFIEVYIDHPRHEKRFIDLMGQLAEVQECHHVAGDFSCLIKVKVRDRRALRELVLDRINALPGVRQTRTILVLETTKETARLSLLPPGSDSTRGRAGHSRLRETGRKV